MNIEPAATTPYLDEKSQRWGTVLLCLLIVWVLGLVIVCSFRIASYAAGQDPCIYIRKGLELREAGLFSAVFFKILSTESVGHLLTMSFLTWIGGGAAGAMTLFYGVGAMMFVSYLLVIRRIFAPNRYLLPFLFGFGIVLVGWQLNPHYLLTPFRETPAFLYLFLGLLCLWRECGNRRFPLWALLAGIFFLMAVGTREPFIFAVISFLIWGGRDELPSRWKNRLVAAAPLGLALSIFALRLVSSGSALTGQQGAGFILIAEKFTEEASWKVWFIYKQHATYLFDQLGVLGCLCLAVGLIAGIRLRAVRWMLIFPGILIYLFYGWMHFANWRYLQESTMFLAPVAGYGALVLCQLLVRVLPARGRAMGSLAFVGAAALVLLGVTIHRAGDVGPWGEKVCPSSGDLVGSRHPQGHAPACPAVI